MSLEGLFDNAIPIVLYLEDGRFVLSDIQHDYSGATTPPETIRISPQLWHQIKNAGFMEVTTIFRVEEEETDV